VHSGQKVLAKRIPEVISRAEPTFASVWARALLIERWAPCSLLRGAHLPAHNGMAQDMLIKPIYARRARYLIGGQVGFPSVNTEKQQCETQLRRYSKRKRKRCCSEGGIREVTLTL